MPEKTQKKTERWNHASRFSAAIRRMFSRMFHEPSPRAPHGARPYSTQYRSVRNGISANQTLVDYHRNQQRARRKNKKTGCFFQIRSASAGKKYHKIGLPFIKTCTMYSCSPTIPYAYLRIGDETYRAKPGPRIAEESAFRPEKLPHPATKERRRRRSLRIPGCINHTGNDGNRFRGTEQVGVYRVFRRKMRPGTEGTLFRPLM